MNATREPSASARSLEVIRQQIDEGTAAKKCHSCGCFQQTVEALAATSLGAGELLPTLQRATSVFTAKKYDCLGCAVCYPAIAANAFTEAFPGAGELMDLCPTEEPEVQAGWPPLPGSYKALRYGARVAVCTLSSPELASALAAAAPEGLAIVGTMQTENLGIERLVQNIIANPNIRCLLLCGEETRQAVGHLPGQSLESLIAHGIDDAGRIVGAKGKRPSIKNVSRQAIDRFREQVQIVSMIGETDVAKIVAEVGMLAASAPDSMDAADLERPVEHVAARAPTRLIPDPSGYFVVYPDRRGRRILVEHFTNAGVFTCMIAGTSPADIYTEVIQRALISRLDHCAYLGQELARAERSLETQEVYVQDRAAGEEQSSPPAELSSSCGCSSPCSTEGAR